MGGGERAYASGRGSRLAGTQHQHYQHHYHSLPAQALALPPGQVHHPRLATSTTQQLLLQLLPFLLLLLLRKVGLVLPSMRGQAVRVQLQRWWWWGGGSGGDKAAAARCES